MCVFVRAFGCWVVDRSAWVGVGGEGKREDLCCLLLVQSSTLKTTRTEKKEGWHTISTPTHIHTHQRTHPRTHQHTHTTRTEKKEGWTSSGTGSSFSKLGTSVACSSCDSAVAFHSTVDERTRAWLVGWLVGWCLFVCLVGWLVGWLVGTRAGEVGGWWVVVGVSRHFLCVPSTSAACPGRQTDRPTDPLIDKQTDRVAH
jgi:hypothetical protein